jgi:hypothetical protein
VIVKIKTEPTDYLEGLTEEDFDYDPDSSLGEVPGVAAVAADSITASIPAKNPNTTPGNTPLQEQMVKVSVNKITTLTITNAVILFLTHTRCH